MSSKHYERARTRKRRIFTEYADCPVVSSPIFLDIMVLFMEYVERRKEQNEGQQMETKTNIVD